MWPFAETANEETTAPAVDRRAEYREAVEREAECLEQIRRAKIPLDAVNDEMLAFKEKYRVKTDRFSRLLGIESPTLAGRPQIEAAWRALLKRRDAVTPEWHQSVHAWSDAKAERERKEANA